MLMKVFLVLMVANIVGIETTSVVAVLASAAFAVGLALVYTELTKMGVKMGAKKK